MIQRYASDAEDVREPVQKPTTCRLHQIKPNLESSGKPVRINGM